MGNLMRGQEPIDSITLLFYAALFNMGSSMIAALYNLFAFLMVGHMGAVGSMIVGNLKTPSIIVACTIIFGGSCTFTQLLGFCTVSAGAYAYNKYGGEIEKGTRYTSATSQDGRSPNELSVGGSS